MIVDNFIYLNIDELTEREWDKLLRSLTFELPNGDVAVGYRRYLTKGYFKLPRGAWYLLPNHVRYHDKRVAPEMPELNFTLKLDDTEKDERFAGQVEALSAMFENEQGQIIRPPGCISGDAVIEVNRGGKSFKTTMRDLVMRLNGGNVHWGRKWDLSIPTMIRARFPDGTIRLTEIKDSWESGKKAVYEVKTKSGRAVRATADHPFLTNRGWRKLSQLRVGTNVYVDGGKMKWTGERKKLVYREIQGLVGHPYALERPHKGYARWSCPAHRIVVEADLNKLALGEYVDRLRANEISGLTFLDPAVVVHHKDNDPTNNKLSNLEVKESPSAHAVEHGVNGGWRRVTARTSIEEIVSITEIGVEETFDLEVGDPSNYIANGFVVHNTGKTQVALAFAAECRTRTLVLVHTADILKQWVEYTENAIPELKGKVGVIQGKRCQVGHITIGMVQSLVKYTHDKKFWQQFGCVIADEAHHVAAPTWEGVLNSCPAYYRFGFTASATRADGMHPAMKYILGPIIYRQKFTSPVKLEVVPVKTNFYAPYRGRFDWGNILRALIVDEERNQQIAKVVDDEINAGNSVLVLSRRIEHLGAIAEAMQAPVEILTARRGKHNRGRILDQFRSGEIRCVLATQLADEALDVPRLNRVCLVHPGKHEGRIVQQIGRALRQHPDKKDAVIYDFYDPRVGVLRRQWDRRKLAYRKNKISIRKRGSLWLSHGRRTDSTSSRQKPKLRKRLRFSKT
jgi:superfamily II DNA or RNA helicase